MKTPLRTLFAASAFLLLLTASLASAQAHREEFTLKFKQAIAINARDEMAKLVREYQDEATLDIVETCQQISQRPSDALEDYIDALRKAWKQSVGTGFVDAMYEYFSLLDPPTKREQNKLRERQLRADARFAELSQTKDGPGLELLGNEMNGIAKGMELVGDNFHASQAWLVYAECFDDTLRGNKADLKKTTNGIGRALELRLAIELEDSWYRSKKARHDFLLAQGWGDEEAPTVGATPAADGAAGPGAAAQPGTPTPAAAATAPLVVPMSFLVLETFDEIERPYYNADALYQMWSGLFFQGKGSKARFPSLEDGPDFYRRGSADVRCDQNSNGTVDDDEKIPLTGNVTPVQITIGKGETERPWAFMQVTAHNKEQFQLVGEINLAPDDNQMTLYAINAASTVGEVHEIPIRVIDDNMDGIYGSPPLSWGYNGISSDNFQPDLDSILIGKAKRAVPWSEYQKIGDSWYKLEPQNAGMSLSVTPVDVETGTLELDFKGGKPDWVVVRGANKFESSYFDIAGAKQVEVPVGQYSLFYGELRKGKKRQVAKSLILPGKGTPKWSVVADQTTEVSLGGPFRFDFRTSRSGSTVTIEGESVVIIGKSDERYERAWNAVPRPEVSWRKAGSKRGSKPDKMDQVSDLEGVIKHSFRGAWSPLDMTIELKGVDEDEKVELQLSQKKNPLFGKVVSDWRE